MYVPGLVSNGNPLVFDEGSFMQIGVNPLFLVLVGGILAAAALVALVVILITNRKK